MKRTLKLIIIVLTLLIVVAFGMFAGFGIYEGHRIRQMFLDDIRRKEAAFRQDPKLVSSLILMENYYEDLKDYEKANYYADYSIKLNVDKTRRGWFVHMVKAKIAAKNNNLAQACNHLNVGLQLAKQNNIPEPHISWFKYQDLLNTCTAKGIK